MKVINSDTGTAEYQRIFRFIQRNQFPLTTWQLHDGKRIIGTTSLASFHLKNLSVAFTFLEQFSLDPSLPLYFYSENLQFIFKTEKSEIRGSQLVTAFPLEIKLLDESETIESFNKLGVDISTTWRTQKLVLEGPEVYSTYMGRVPKPMAERSSRDQNFLKDEFDMLSLDEEDKKFADKRESVRVRPKAGKIVKVMLKDDPNIHVMRLFDLSQGGLAFISQDLGPFPKTSEVIVIGFGEFDLDDPLVGMIMSHRPVDESEREFKIGIKFNDGQD